MIDKHPLEERLGVQFRAQGLLKQALTHSSYINENPWWQQESNQRLEFLGDALLGLVVAEELFRRCPGRSEGELTYLRSYVVTDQSLARVAQELGLGQHLLMGKGEESLGGRERPSNLAGALEALAAALFLDQGFEAARSTLLKLLDKAITDAVARGIPKHPKAMLQEALQARGYPLPTYRVVEVTGPDHARHYTVEVAVAGRVLGRGTGHSKQEAERAAAQEALAGLDAASSQ